MSNLNQYPPENKLAGVGAFHPGHGLRHISVVLNPVRDVLINLLTVGKYTRRRSLLVDRLLAEKEKS